MKKFILILVLAVVIIPALLIGALVFEYWHLNNYKSVVQILESDGEENRFVLMTDIAGFGDQAWYVYQIRSGKKLSDAMREGHNTQGTLFWNYSETEDHTSDPKIEIINKRYLVFSRGGLYHSLYDLAKLRVLVNEESPWAAFLSGSGNNADQTELRNFRKWKVQALHTPILQILK